MTKDKVFKSLYRIYNSWEELAKGNSDFVGGFRHSVPIIPNQNGKQLQEAFNESMSTLREAFKSIADGDSLSSCCVSHPTDKGDNKIRFEQTTIGLRKTICEEIYRLMFDYHIIWTDDNEDGIWWRANDIFNYSNPDSIIHACTKETIELSLIEIGKDFHIFTDIESNTFSIYLKSKPCIGM